eukprot:3537779-Alexandrium_andersonii.AAC.1
MGPADAPTPAGATAPALSSDSRLPFTPPAKTRRAPGRRPEPQHVDPVPAHQRQRPARHHAQDLARVALERDLAPGG